MAASHTTRGTSPIGAHPGVHMWFQLLPDLHALTKISTSEVYTCILVSTSRRSNFVPACSLVERSTSIKAGII